MKKKFSLGDILKKMNDEQDLKLESREEKQYIEPTDQKQPNIIQPVQKYTTGKDNQEQINPQNNNELPLQPHLGNKTNSGVQRSTSPIVSQSNAPAPTTNTTQSQYSSDEKTISSPENITALTEKLSDNKNINIPERFFNEEEEEESFDFFKYVGILLRRKNVVLAVMLLMTAFSIFNYMTGKKYYITSARLLFKPNSEEIVADMPNLKMIDYDKTFNTHLVLLGSHSVLNMVSNNLSGKIRPEEISPSLSIKRGETNGQKNDIIELSFKNSDPEMTKDVLNEVCKTYIDYRRDVNSQEITRLIYKFEVQINKVQEDLNNKENDLRNFKELNKMVQMSSETNTMVSKLTAMELALQQTGLSLVEIQQRLTVLNSQISKQELDIVQSITYDDPFQSKLSNLELELNSLSAQYSPEHFKVKGIKQQIDNIKSATIDSLTREAASKTFVINPIRQSLLQDFINLTIEKSALEEKKIAQQRIVEQLNVELLRLPAIDQKYAYLERETESLLQTLRMLKTKYEEAKIKRDSQESDLKFLEMAELPNKSISKVGIKNIIIGILIGLILGIALALLFEYLDQSLKEPRDVERVLELPLLGVVPLIETEKALLKESSDLAKTILEPFRALRANLKHIATQHNIKTFIVCSAIKGEGKTTLSANLAITFSLDGKKIILVDGDLRRSQIHTLFSTSKENGLSDYLLGTAELKDIIKPTVYPNLFIITSGSRPENPAELLGTVRFDEFLKEIRDCGDIILFDSPALLPVSDSMTMAPKIDCCVMLVRTLWTPLKAAKQAKNQLKRIGTKIYGGIINGVSHSRNYYPYYYGYYGYSSYKYTYEDDVKKKFSLREFGLTIENVFKTHLKNIVYSIPRYISYSSLIVTHLIKRKFFWILLLLFFSLGGLLLWTDNHTSVKFAPPITYIGLSNSQQSSKKVSLIDDMALPKSDKATNNITTTNSAGLKDSITTWLNALSTRDLRRYLAFYNNDTFKFSDGNYTDWEQINTILFSTPMIDSMFLDSIVETKSGASHIETKIYTHNEYNSLHTFDLVWQIDNNSWRIVSEK
jgi:tyrosine-protein kinase Etk/Wzc